MPFFSKFLISYLTIGIGVVLFFRYQLTTQADLLKVEMEMKWGIKKSRNYWLYAMAIISSLIWPVIVYRIIKKLRE